jgi:hypothetical protein
VNQLTLKSAVSVEDVDGLENADVAMAAHVLSHFLALTALEASVIEDPFTVEELALEFTLDKTN